MRIEVVKKKFGFAKINPEVATPGQTGCWTVTFKPQIKIEVGGEIRFTLPFLFDSPQIIDPKGSGYVSVSCDNPNCLLQIEKEQPWFTQKEFMHSLTKLMKIVKNDISKRVTSPVGTNFRVKVLKNPLEPGNTITLIYGDTSQGGPGGRILPSREREWVNIYITVDPDGKRKAPHTGFYRISDLPVLKINPNRPKMLKVVVPSIIDDEKSSIPVHIIAYDGLTLHQNPILTTILSYPSKYGKLASGYQAEIEYELNGEKRGKVKLRKNKPVHSFQIDSVFTYKKFNFITVIDKENSLIAKSNPFILKTQLSPPYKSYNLYWGDLHIMDGAFFATQAWKPQNYYQYAIDTGLNFAAVTDICRETPLFDVDTKINRREWENIKAASYKFYQPGKFVTFPAYEYNERFSGGDRNVYFLNEEEAELYCWDNPQFSTPKKLWAALKNKKAMTIPHHPACILIGQNWDHHCPELQRLVEIYSEWGNSEGPGCERPMKVPTDYINRSVQSALARGYKLGFLASSDTHSGDVGEAALAAVWAEELTREKVWEALWKRHCYGTTGARIIVEFSINGYMMGEEIPGRRDEKRTVFIKVIGTDKIKRIDVIRNNELLYSHKGCKQMEEFEYVDREDPVNLPLYPILFYYIRVIQIDREIAWSSPIWINLGKNSLIKRSGGELQ